MAIIDDLIKVVRAVASEAPAAIAAGDAVLDLVKSIGPTLAEQDQRKLQDALPPLLGRMNRDVDQAIRDLGGTGN